MNPLKHSILTLFALLPLASAFAQGVNADYDRSSLTVVSVGHGDRYDAISSAYLSKYNPGGDKFDATRVNTQAVKASYGRYVRNDQQNAITFARLHESDIRASLEKEHVARQVIGAWFNRSAQGVMDLNVVNKRADYNATDQTYNVAKAQALGEYLLHGEGLKLIENSYILVVDHSNPEREYIKNSNGAVTGVKFSTQALGYLYKVVFDDAARQSVYDCWIYTDDSPATRKAKNAAWDKLNFGLKLVGISDQFSTGQTNLGNGNNNEQPALDYAVSHCAPTLINYFEKHVDAWKVKSGIFAVKPIRAKIGTKEGVSRMSRFRVDEFILEEDGSVTSRRKGYVRATEVADNRTAAKGASAVSEFYQIAGGTLEPGMELVQKPSINLELKGLYYGGSRPGYGLEADIAFGLKTNGCSHHVRIGGSFFSYKAGTGNGEYELTVDHRVVDVRMGYGYGFRPVRWVELIPNASLLADNIDSKLTEDVGQNADGTQSEKSFMLKTGWGFEAGLDMNITVFYPVKLTAGAYWSQTFTGGDFWKQYNSGLEMVGIKRNGLTWRAGLVYEF